MLVAANSAMFDHLSGGRFILGISPGALTSDAEALGILDEDRTKMFAEAIDVIERIWELDPPYSIDLPDNRWKVTTESTLDRDFGVGIMPKPLQQPRPEIVGTVVAPFSKGVIAMGQRDFHPMSANFLLPQWVATHWPNYVQGKEAAGLVADKNDWRVARTVFVARRPGGGRGVRPHRREQPVPLLLLPDAEEDAQARTAGAVQDPPRPAGRRDHPRLRRSTSWSSPGRPTSVTEQLVGFHEEVGGFGELVYAGLDWVDAGLAKRSMELMAQKVMPGVNAALGSDA